MNAFLGVSSFDLTEINIYPNPTSGWVTVSNNLSGTVNFTLTEIDGRVVKQGIAENESFMIDLSTLTTGMYMLHFEKDQTKRSLRILKQ